MNTDRNIILLAEVERMQSNIDERTGGVVRLMAERDTLRTQNQALLEALKDAATSLQTISLFAGLKVADMDSMSDVRGYAHSRCTVAMTAAIALAEGKDV